MDKNKEAICLKALDDLLNANIDDACYCLNGSKESAVCLELTQNGWEVYDKERNAKDDNMLFTNIVEACLEMIQRLFRKTEVEFYKNVFLNAIVGYQKTA